MKKGFSLITLALFIIGFLCIDSYPRGGRSFGGSSFGGRSSSSFRSSGSSYRSSGSSYRSSYGSSYRSSYPSYGYRGYYGSQSYSGYAYRSSMSNEEEITQYFNGQSYYARENVNLPARNFFYDFSFPELQLPAVPYIEKKVINFILLFHQFLFLGLAIGFMIRNYRKFKDSGRLVVFKRCFRDIVICLVSVIFLYGIISIFTPARDIRHIRIKNLIDSLLKGNPSNPEGISYNIHNLIRYSSVELRGFDLTAEIVAAMVKNQQRARENLSYALYRLVNIWNYRVKFGVQNSISNPVNSEMLNNLKKFFISDNVIVRRAVAYFIGGYSSKNVTNANAILPSFPKSWVKNPDNVIRQIGFHFISRNFAKEKEYVVQIIEQLNHSENTVRLSAVKALNYIYYQNAILDSTGNKLISKIIRDLSNKIIPLLNQAGFLVDTANYIGLTKNNSALPLLLKAAKTAMSEEEAQAVAWALGALKKNTALPVLNKIAKNTGKLSAEIAKLAVEYINLGVDKK